MASVSSRSRSPHSPSPYDFSSDADESWQYIDYSAGASSNAGGAASSIDFLPSPASGSLNGYAVIGHVPHSPIAPSPLFLDPEPPAATAGYAAPGFAEQSDVSGAVAASSSSEITALDPDFLNTLSTTEPLLPQHILWTQEQLNELAILNNLQSPLSPFLFEQAAQQPQLDLSLSQPLPPNLNIDPWSPSSLRQEPEMGIFVMDPVTTPSPHASTASSILSSPAQSGPHSPPIVKKEKASSRASSSISPMRKVKDGKVDKKKANNANDAQAGRFLIVTPTSISAHAGRPNPFECFEAQRATSQRGRKGPLANETKENALLVRRRGACFCCHARKVKCDTQRPCRNCQKLMHTVPQVVCWQFQDFLGSLFPPLIRDHLRKEAMARFFADNIAGFTVGGEERPCQVQLYAGSRFLATLTLSAKFFTPKTAEVMEHWHLNISRHEVDLQAKSTIPIGVELDNTAQRDEIKKKSKEYIQAIIKEPHYAEQLTDSFSHTDVPRRVLSIVQRYAHRSDSPIVKRALSIYAMQYIMTRHLCLSETTLGTLEKAGFFSRTGHAERVTPRVLNRQIKAVVDEMLMRETTQLFELFSKQLKPKSRQGWAPCLAAFLVFCLFMEAVETTTDQFVMAENEISLRKHRPQPYRRKQALDVCREVENMPFKQFAYQFHQIYLTHTKDASSKSFNPLLDDCFQEQNELDEPAVEMVMMLRELLQRPDWDELDFLTMDPILPNAEHHPFPRDVSLNYTGRLLAKFLLSFTDEKYIFDIKS